MIHLRFNADDAERFGNDSSNVGDPGSNQNAINEARTTVPSIHVMDLSQYSPSRSNVKTVLVSTDFCQASPSPPTRL